MQKNQKQSKANNMQYFDIQRVDADKELIQRLGFARAFHVGNEVNLITEGVKPYSEKKNSIVKGSPRFINRFLKSKTFIGAIIKSAKPDKLLLSALKDHNKIVFLDIAELTNMNQESRVHEIRRLNLLLKHCKSRKIRTCIATFADSKSQLLSKLQLLEIGKLIGAEEHDVKEMLSTIGRLNDT